MHVGIMADFFGSEFPGGLNTVDEYKEVIGALPPDGFKDQFSRLCVVSATSSQRPRMKKGMQHKIYINRGLFPPVRRYLQLSGQRLQLSGRRL
jgi:hypothetical protein